MFQRKSTVLLFLLGSLAWSDLSGAAPKEPVRFNHDIRPILSGNCFSCHGADREDLKAGLSLASFTAATDPQRRGGPGLVPGERGKSLLWQRINEAGDPMPPVSSHKHLTTEQIELLGRWIDEGAAYDRHWAYKAPASSPVPEVRDETWPRGTPDRFILTRLEQEGLAPRPEAGPTTLLRRICLDLTGLPPTPQQREQFLQDQQPDAYERLVDRLLQSPAFGEHFAGEWLDLVRYADTVGYHGDQPRTMWPYRTWVIEALNTGMSFDQFTAWQLAGDLLAREETDPQRKRDMLIASAYNRLNMVTAEGGAQDAEYEAIYAADRVQNFSEVWMASSMGCARCHDHKYDPFSLRDFYSMAAFFSDIQEVMVSNQQMSMPTWPPFMFVPETDEQRAAVKDLDAEYHQVVEAHYQKASDLELAYNNRYAQPKAVEEWEKAFVELIKKRTALGKSVPTVPITRALEEPRPVHLLPRGNWMDRSGPVMPAAYPGFLAQAEAGHASAPLNRLDLARWLFEPGHPLTARVVVNRLWTRFFGRGLSGNPMDLGSQGDAPSYPELLDYLAMSFRDSGWNLKQSIRVIVTSSVYRQDSNRSPEWAERDPENRMLARQGALRLSAEVLRDQALQVAGLLRTSSPGASVFPYQPDGHWEPLNFPRRPYPTSTGDDLYRRSVYTWIQRSFPHPVLVNFDAPNRETCVAQRLVSNTPLQALTLLNETSFVEAARLFACRLLAATHPNDRDRLWEAFQQLLAREPLEEEAGILLALLATHRQHFEAQPEEAARLAAVGTAPCPEDLALSEVAAWTSVTRALLNLHETVTRN